MVAKGLHKVKIPPKKELLLAWADAFEHISFIAEDPISVPHRFSKKEDIEIAGFFAATLAWGLRKTIINNSVRLMKLMDNAPYDFIINHQPRDLKKMEGFVHRTFQTTDLLFFIDALQRIYQKYGGLESVMSNNENIASGIENFRHIFFDSPFAPERSKKHVSSPVKGSTCKRLNMYLRWMVRSNKKGVDFGIWKSIKPAQLLCPLDVHVSKTARELNLILSPTDNWNTVVELTDNLKLLDENDPVKFDFALFGMSWYQRVNGSGAVLWPPPKFSKSI